MLNAGLELHQLQTNFDDFLRRQINFFSFFFFIFFFIPSLILVYIFGLAFHISQIFLIFRLLLASVS